MSTTTTTTASSSATAKPASAATKRGNNLQPSRQTYKNHRPSQTVKRWTETIKSYLKVRAITPEQRSAIAFFTLQPERNGGSN